MGVLSGSVINKVYPRPSGRLHSNRRLEIGLVILGFIPSEDGYPIYRKFVCEWKAVSDESACVHAALELAKPPKQYHECQPIPNLPLFRLDYIPQSSWGTCLKEKKAKE